MNHLEITNTPVTLGLTNYSITGKPIINQQRTLKKVACRPSDVGYDYEEKTLVNRQ